MQASTSTLKGGPCFLGGAEQLFGFYHDAHPSVRRDAGVVICGPLFEEYSRAHRTLRLMAVRLARAGFPVLRFDYFGCGDSAGDLEDASVTRWLEDIAKAANELKTRASVSRPLLVGVRFGATLAALAANRREDFRAIVLWDPIVSGKSYLNAMRIEHDRWREARGQALQANDGVQGYPLTEALTSEVAEIDLLATQTRPAEDMLVTENGETRQQEPLARHLEAMGARVDHELLADPVVWKEGAVGLVANKTIRRAVSWLCEVSP